MPMGRFPAIIFLFALTTSAGCQTIKVCDMFDSKKYSEVTFQVGGMMSAKSGAT